MADKAKTRSKESVSSAVDGSCVRERIAGFSRPVTAAKAGASKSSPADVGKRKRVSEDGGQDECVALQDIRKVGTSMREWLMECASRISKANASVMLDKIAEMENVLLNVLLDNERLKGQLSECRVNDARNAREKESMVRTYASVTGTGTSERSVSASVSAVNTPPPRVNERHALVIRPTKVGMTSAEVKSKLMNEVRPALANVRVNAVRMLKKGGIAIETASAEELQRVKECPSFKNAGLSVNSPRKIGPKVIIYDVPNEWSTDVLMNAVYEGNLKDVCMKDEFKERARVISRGGKKGSDVGNVVIELSKRMCDCLVANGRLYVEWRALKVRHFEVVYRCYGCYGFGHRMSECKVKERVCKKCGKTGHKHAECKSENEVCRNCVERKSDANHSVLSDKCPEYVRALERMRALIHHG